jgi:hypothetical protein
MGRGFGELDDLFRSEPRFGEGWESALLRRRAAGGAGSLAARSGAGVAAAGGSEGGEGETQSPGVPLVGAGGGVAAVSPVAAISRVLWGRCSWGFLLGRLRLDADDCEFAGDGSGWIRVDFEMLAEWI